VRGKTLSAIVYHLSRLRGLRENQDMIQISTFSASYLGSLIIPEPLRRINHREPIQPSSCARTAAEEQERSVPACDGSVHRSSCFVPPEVSLPVRMSDITAIKKEETGSSPLAYGSRLPAGITPLLTLVPRDTPSAPLAPGSSFQSAPVSDWQTV
jgi:hypothetical protein